MDQLSRALGPFRRVSRRRTGARLEHGPEWTAGLRALWTGGLAAVRPLLAAGLAAVLPASAPPTVSETAATPTPTGSATSATVTSSPSESGRRRRLTGPPPP